MDEAMEKRWPELSEEVLSEMKEWRVAHPEATFREIEDAVQEHMSGLTDFPGGGKLRREYPMGGSHAKGSASLH